MIFLSFVFAKVAAVAGNHNTMFMVFFLRRILCAIFSTNIANVFSFSANFIVKSAFLCC
jgi:hypothetical protein